MKTKYFVGENYDTLAEKNVIFNNYDKLKQDKLIFINELYDNENTQKSLWSIYTNHIHEHELELGKDVMFFSNIEVDDIVASRFKYAQTTKDQILNFINKYKDWGVDRGDIINNSTKAINRKTTTRSLTNVLINKVWGLGEFYNLLIKIEGKNLGNSIPLLLARYGIMGKELIEMRQLRWEDIDFEKKQVKIVNEGKVERILDVDDRFVKWIDKYRLSLDSDEDDFGYVLKKPKRSQNNDSLMMGRATIDSKVYRACDDAKITRIALGDLLKSRYLDYLLEIRKERMISVDDIEWVQLNFKGKVTLQITTSMIEFYESLTKDKIVVRNNAGRIKSSLKDPASKQVVKDIIEKIGYEEFVNGKESFENTGLYEVSAGKES